MFSIHVMVLNTLCPAVNNLDEEKKSCDPVTSNHF